MNFQHLGKAVLATEAKAVQDLVERVDQSFDHACQKMLECQGRIVVLGMGKSGHIGGKIAATLASTGTPAFFVHPGEASHGDLGMITKQDLVLALSNSGETNEITSILPIIKRLNVPLVSMTGNPNSTLAKMADVHLDVSVFEEACPLGLAPTSSSTAALAMGDALAVALLDARGFTEHDFARSHPGGSLGKRLLLLVDDIMHTGEHLPKVEQSATLAEVLLVMTEKSLGMAAIVDPDNKVLGIFTDGDLRRTLKNTGDVTTMPINELMSVNPVCAQKGMLAAECLSTMQRKKINGLLVVDDENTLIGALNMQDFLRAGVY